MVQTLKIRDGDGAIKSAAVGKGTGESTDPYYLAAIAPIDYLPAGINVVTVANVITLLVAANPNRRSLILQNRGDNPIDIFISGTGGTFGQGFLLNKNDIYQISGHELHLEEIRAIAETGSSNVTLLEGI
jgi:hypothetical protein